jgi:hypothetical protein
MLRGSGDEIASIGRLLTERWLHRRRDAKRLLARSTVRCLRLVQAFADGAKLLEAADRYRRAS